MWLERTPSSLAAVASIAAALPSGRGRLPLLGPVAKLGAAGTCFGAAGLATDGDLSVEAPLPCDGPKPGW